MYIKSLDFKRTLLTLAFGNDKIQKCARQDCPKKGKSGVNAMSQEVLKMARKVIGAKQTLKAAEKQKLQQVFLGNDAEQKVIEPIRRTCQMNGIAIDESLTMVELGRLCEIEVGAAAVGVMKESQSC